jgi:signal transduction histidine kinase
MASYVAASFYRLSQAWRQSRGVRRVQMRYFLLGAGIFLLSALLFDLALPAFGIFFLNLIGPLSSIAFVGFAAYAIVHYEFLDIKVIIRRSVTYFASIVAVAIVFFSVEFVIEKFFYNDEVVDIIAAMVGAFAFAWFKDFFGKLTDRIFFRADYDYAQAVRELGPLLNSTIELKGLVGIIDGFLARTIRPAKTIFLTSYADVPFAFTHEQHLPEDSSPDTASHQDFVPLRNPPMRGMLIMQEADFAELTDEGRAYSRAAERLGFSAVVPLVAKDAMVGTLFVGKKLSDDILRPKDIGLLSVLSHQGGMAIENARLYESIRRSNEELEDIVAERTKEMREMYRAQEQFVTDISHQLQTPIAILEGNLELAEHRPTGQTKNTLRTMRDTLDGMAHLVSHFLEIARLNFSKNKFHRERFDVGELLRGTHEDCLVLAETKGVRFDCSAESAVVAGDRRKIKEVLLNLLSNALKHTEAHGTIALEGVVRGDFFEIAVRDTGTGIPSENLPHIFERFYRIPGTSTHGTGLGLNICREIIELHGGTIYATSVVGEGSVFTVCLPLAPHLDPGASGIL